MEDHPDSNVMMSPMPETPVLRVTDPKTKTMPTTSQLSRQKDPKKVAMGCAGAAARKAKQAHLLEELRKAKESLQSPKDTPGAPSKEDVAAPSAGTPAKEKDETAAPVLCTAGSITPWIRGAAAGLGQTYWAALQCTPVDPPVLPPTKSVTPPVLSPDGSAQQLKVSHNLFYME